MLSATCAPRLLPRIRKKPEQKRLVDNKLNTAGVGELFVIADEFKSKGDLIPAKAALRVLIPFFPNYKLAAQAVEMLGDLQAK